MRKLIILGSSRKEGNTKKVVDQLNSLSSFEILQLSDYSINHYDYNHKYEADDFQELCHACLLVFNEWNNESFP